MMISKTIGTVSAITVFLGLAGASYAGDACKNVKFQFINNRDKTIVITSVDYHNDVSVNNPRHEKIYDPVVERCYAGVTCHTVGDNLTDAEGENLTNFVFYFNEYDSNGIKIDKGWKTQPKIPDDKRCTANRTYGDSKTNPWTID